MARVSAWRGNWQPNARPYITLTSDVYVAVQGSISITACAECNRQININDYITGTNTESSVDTPPGSATITLSVPDNDVNNFFTNGQFIIIPMMEIEIYAKGYYLIGGFPQYYKIFWGLVSSVTKDWSSGSTTISISCKDILRWWEVTNTTVNPALLNGSGGSAGSIQMYGNQFAGQNPYATIVQLAKEAMGDFSLTTSSLNQNILPEKGPERGVIGAYAKDIMQYWQLKFANIWSNLVLYGMSGQAFYTTSSTGQTVQPDQLAATVQAANDALLTQGTNQQLLQSNSTQVATAKREIPNAGRVNFTQADIQSKLTLALQARDQLTYEFFCDPSGAIVFKPPLYNLNVLPNKPTSWINDFEIIDDSITDTEQDVYTHITSSGSAFGGVNDYGIATEFATPRAGVYDFHLLRLYGFRRIDYSTEWAGDPTKLFWHLLDYLDRINSKRQNGTITIPMRPELKLGFPVWVPGYDSFVYVQGLSHQFSVGGQATTTITWIARRQKFFAPNNLGQITLNAGPTVSSQNKAQGTSNFSLPQGTTKSTQAVQKSYSIEFPDQPGASASLASTYGNTAISGQANPIRDPTTGKFLGCPSVVMVFRSDAAGGTSKLMQQAGSAWFNSNNQNQGGQTPVTGIGNPLNQISGSPGALLNVNATAVQTTGEKYKTLARLGANRYSGSMINEGLYDYAQDVGNNFLQYGMIPVTSIFFGVGSTQPANSATPDNTPAVRQIKAATASVVAALNNVDKQNAYLFAATANAAASASANNGASAAELASIGLDVPSVALNATVIAAQADVINATIALQQAQAILAKLDVGIGQFSKLQPASILIRPISDEFGFEVIGNNRYGRGCYIDQGGVKIAVGPTGQAPGSTANQINIQFAATSGLITDPSQVQPGSGQVTNFAAQFEQMQPADWKTGGSFAGVAGNTPATTNNVYTSAATYTSSMQANVGTGVFAEADQTRKSTSLLELSPNSNIQGATNATPNCPCGLDRANWLSILPLSFIQTVLQGGQQLAPITAGVTTTGPGDGFIIASPTNEVSSTGAILGASSPSDFFSQLDMYLSQQFVIQYKQNSQRELQDTGQSYNYQSQLFTSDTAAAQDNVLGFPSDPLFGPASLGSPTALAGLQSQVNFNFGLGSQAVANASSAFNNNLTNIQGSSGLPVGSVSFASIAANLVAGEKAASVNLVTASTNPVPSPLSPSILQPVPQPQPVTVIPNPNILNLIVNPSNNTLLAQKLYPSTAGTTPGEVTPPGPPTSVGQQ